MFMEVDVHTHTHTMPSYKNILRGSPGPDALPQGFLFSPMQTVPFLQACSVAPLLFISHFLLSADSRLGSGHESVFPRPHSCSCLLFPNSPPPHQVDFSLLVSPMNIDYFSVHPSSRVLYIVPLPTDLQAAWCPGWSHAIPPHLQTLACGRCYVKKHPLNSSFTLKIPCWFRVCVKQGQDCLNSPWFGCSRGASVRCFKSS